MFDGYLKPFGYVKNKNIWVKENLETIQVIELMKSQRSSVFILNVGIIIKKLQNDNFKIEFPSCNLWRDTLHLVDDIKKREYLIKLLDIDIQEEQIITENIKKYINYLEEIKIIDLLNELSNHQGIINYLKEKKHHKYLYTKYFREEEVIKYLQ